MSYRRRHHPELFNPNFALQTKGARTANAPSLNLLVNGGTLLSPQQNFTIGGWFYPRTWTAGTTIVGYVKNGNKELFRLIALSNSTLSFQWGFGDYNLAGQRTSVNLGGVVLNAWNYVSLAAQLGTEFRGRLNATETLFNTAGQVSIFNDTVNTVQQFGFNKPLDNNSYNVDGFVSHYFGIQEALSFAQMAAIRSAGRVTVQSVMDNLNLLRYLPCDSTQGITARDLGPYNTLASLQGNYLTADTELGGYHWQDVSQL